VLPTNNTSPGALTLGPDGNLWFVARSSSNRFNREVGRITPAGVITEFPLSPGVAYATPTLTVGSDGNLWFAEPNGGKIGQIVVAALPVVAVTHSRKEIMSITLRFPEALNPSTAGTRSSYHLTTAVRRRHQIVSLSRGVKIRRVAYDINAHQVTLKLARPHRGPVQVTVSGVIVSADGASSNGGFTAVVT
jgi:hypothetical protein